MCSHISEISRAKKNKTKKTSIRRGESSNQLTRFNFHEKLPFAGIPIWMIFARDISLSNGKCDSALTENRLSTICVAFHQYFLHETSYYQYPL